LMRRIYYRFPGTYDLDFDLNRPFPEVLGCIRRLHDTHQTSRRGTDLVKRQILVQLATNKMSFEMVDSLPPFEETVTEMADFRLIVHDILLAARGRVPLGENIFLMRVQDKGPLCECIVVKEGQQGAMDAAEFKTLIKGACP